MRKGEAPKAYLRTKELKQTLPTHVHEATSTIPASTFAKAWRHPLVPTEEVEHVVAAADADNAFGTLFRSETKKMSPEFLDIDMHPPTPIGDEAVDVFEPNEEDTMTTGILDDSDAEASDDEATPAPTAAESHVHEVADVEEPKLSKLAALRIVLWTAPSNLSRQLSLFQFQSTEKHVSVILLALHVQPLLLCSLAGFQYLRPPSCNLDVDRLYCRLSFSHH